MREAALVPHGLDDVHELLRRLGDPHHAFGALHVAGTKGKGSTCALLAAALEAAGIRVGLTTSPHLHHVTERIRTAGREVEADRLLDALTRVREAAGDDLQPSFFVALIAAAFLTFHEDRVDVAVVEVGVGGRLDATNVVRPHVTAITRLGLDHADRLGSTRAAIAREKAGILKPGVPCVLAPNRPEAEAEVVRRAGELGVRLRRLTTADVESAPRTALPGAVQGENAAVAWGVLEELAAETSGRLAVGRSCAERGFAAVRWPARLQLVRGSTRWPDLLVDVAHDVESVQALAEHVEACGRPGAAVFTCLADKDLDGMASVLARSGVLVRVPVLVPSLGGARARDSADVVGALARRGLDAHACEGLPAALERARVLASGRLILAFGSFQVAGAALRAREAGTPGP